MLINFLLHSTKVNFAGIFTITLVDEKVRPKYSPQKPVSGCLNPLIIIITIKAIAPIAIIVIIRYIKDINSKIK